MGFSRYKKNLLLSQLSHDYPFILAISIHSKPYEKGWITLNNVKTYQSQVKHIKPYIYINHIFPIY